MRSFWLRPVLIVLMLANSTFSQTRELPPGRIDDEQTRIPVSRIRGRVTGANNSAPLAGALVRVSTTEARISQIAKTDEDGRYEIGSLAAGRYTITVTKPGYVTLHYGQRRPFERGKQLEIAEGQVIDHIDFIVPRGGVITGRVLEQSGAPATGAQVRALRYQYLPNGEHQLVPGGNIPITDDLGQYRLYGLMPGTYLLFANNSVDAAQVVNRDGGMSRVVPNGYAAAYYPGSANAEAAQPIPLELGQEFFADLTLVSSRLANVSGIVRNSQGRIIAGANVTLRSINGVMIDAPKLTRTSSDGSFVMQNVTPGEFRVEVRLGPGEQEFASVPISLADEDVAGIVITTGIGATVTGRLAFNGTTPRPVSVPVRVGARTDDLSQVIVPSSNPDNGIVDNAGMFRIAGVTGNVLFRPMQLPTGWSLRSVTLNGREITDHPVMITNDTAGVEITVTNRQSTLVGFVRNGRGETLKDYVVIVLPRDVAAGLLPSRYIMALRPDQEGRYQTREIVPGQYVAVAVESLDAGDEWNPAVQKQLRERARAFTIGEGQTLNFDLVLAD